MNTEFQTALSTFESRLNSLVTSLTTSPTASGAPTAALNLLSADDSLSSTIDTLKDHQSNHARILQLRAEAQSLEDRVKDIVRLVVRYEKDIRETCGDDETDSEYDSEDDEIDVDASEPSKPSRKRVEVDYKLLLDFARRISKYNHEAAADAASGKRKQKPAITNQDTEMTGTTNGTQPTLDIDPSAEPVAAVTKDATSWLDESANMTRQIYMLPYPLEDRIRLGLMGQIQLAAAEGRPDFDPEQEVERLIREAEGVGVAAPGAVAPVEVDQTEDAKRAGEAARAAALAGSSLASGAPTGAAPGMGIVSAPPKPKPKATLDLDLYDPDEDDD